MSSSAGGRILFVCAGNICRSPVAEGVFRNAIEKRGLSDYYGVDSAGTGSWHVGQKPDRRMRQTASGHGVDLEALRARQFTVGDFEAFDHIFVMDRDNLHDVSFLDPEDRYGHKIRLFRELDPQPEDYQVPDPYYGPGDGFETVYAIVERTVDVMIDRLEERRIAS